MSISGLRIGLDGSVERVTVEEGDLWDVTSDLTVAHTLDSDLGAGLTLWQGDAREPNLLATAALRRLGFDRVVRGAVLISGGEYLIGDHAGLTAAGEARLRAALAEARGAPSDRPAELPGADASSATTEGPEDAQGRPEGQ